MTAKKHSKNVSIDFNLRQLEIFQQVVEQKSFSKAAGKVFLAQASVSERISNLENMVGVRLLDRLGRQVVPTRAGEILYKHAILLLEMKRTAVLEMQEFLGLKKGEIFMGASTIPGEYILPSIIGDFYQAFPHVRITMEVSDSGEIESRVLDGKYELGVIGAKSTRDNIMSQELWKDELLLVVSGGHKWAKRKSIDLDELKDEPFILREQGSGTQKILDRYLNDSGLSGIGHFNRVARLGTSTAIKEGIKAGLGISILSSRAVGTEIKDGLLRAIKIKKMNLTRSFYLIRDKRKIASPLCHAMMKFLRESLKKSSMV